MMKLFKSYMAFPSFKIPLLLTREGRLIQPCVLFLCIFFSVIDKKSSKPLFPFKHRLHDFAWVRIKMAKKEWTSEILG